MSDAVAAQAVDVAFVPAAKIPVAFGAMVHVGTQAVVTLALLNNPIIQGLPGVCDIMDFPQVADDLPEALFPVPLPAGTTIAMAAAGPMTPNFTLSQENSGLPTIMHPRPPSPLRGEGVAEGGLALVDVRSFGSDGRGERGPELRERPHTQDAGAAALARIMRFPNNPGHSEHCSRFS